VPRIWVCQQKNLILDFSGAVCKVPIPSARNIAKFSPRTFFGNFSAGNEKGRSALASLSYYSLWMQEEFSKQIETKEC
jgi:hypothetical protein